MDKASEYRAHAAAAETLAARSEDDEFKVVILKLAQSWLELAERVERRDRRPKKVMRLEAAASRPAH
jgi:hypothetical protein